MTFTLQEGLLIYSILYFFGFLAVLSINIRQQSTLSKNLWFLLGFFLLNAVGVLFIYYRESLPLFISVIVANTMLYVGYLSLFIGISKFYKRKIPVILLSIHAVLFITLFVLFTYVSPNFQIRIVIFCTAVISIAGSLLYIHGLQLKTFNVTKSIFGIMVTLVIIANVWRLLMLLVPNDATSFLDYDLDAINIIFTGLAGNMISFGILAIINNKMFDDIQSVGNIFVNSITNAPSPIMIHAEDGTVINISNDWTVRTNYDIEDIPTIFEWTSKAYGKNKEEVRAFIRKLYISTETQHDGEFVVTTKDGRQLTWDFNSGYIGKLPDGRKVAMSVATDVSERILKEKQISYLSYHDQLTGIYNRRFFEEQLKRLDNPRNLPLSIVMGDVNGLKLINDAFGHKAGDLLLETIGNIINDNIRGNDVAARWGGDEFAILLPSSDVKAAETLIARIQACIDKANFEYGAVSISFGAETKYKMEEDLTDIFNSAEEIMYQKKLNEIDSIRGETINTIMNTLFEKSIEVKDHSLRVSQIAEAIADKMGLSQTRINDIKTMGLIHDIGKIVIDLNILDKPGKLNTEERDIIENHPLSGSRMLSSSHEYTRLAAGVLHHHERIDGSGYPNGLSGDQIPIESRIIGVADAFDAMTAERPYRVKPLTIPQAIEELQIHSGTQFDKDIVDILVKKVLKK